MAGKKTNHELKPKQRRAIQALASGYSIAKTAEMVGAGERTIYRWKQDADFVSALRDADAENLQELARKLTTATNGALKVLIEVTQDAKAPQSVRVRAASEILKHRAAFYELVTLQEQVSTIESRLEAGGL